MLQDSKTHVSEKVGNVHRRDPNMGLASLLRLRGFAWASRKVEWKGAFPQTSRGLLQRPATRQWFVSEGCNWACLIPEHFLQGFFCISNKTLFVFITCLFIKTHDMRPFGLLSSCSALEQLCLFPGVINTGVWARMLSMCGCFSAIFPVVSRFLFPARSQFSFGYLLLCFVCGRWTCQGPTSQMRLLFSIFVACAVFVHVLVVLVEFVWQLPCPGLGTRAPGLWPGDRTQTWGC